MLSTKVYWDKSTEKNKFRKFWKEYQEIDNLKDENEKKKQKEILFIKNDLDKVLANENKYFKIISFYKSKLVDFGVMKRLSAKCTTLPEGIYIKELEKTKKSKSGAKVKKK